MKLALVGYGKMGRLIEQLAPQYGFEVVLRLDEFNNASGEAFTASNFAGVDVAIEFSTPEVALSNIKSLAELRIPTVVGTTGWLAHMEKARATVEQNGSALVWSPNFSVGVQIFFRLAAEMARWMAAQQEYGAWAWEIHHNTKKDAPSGTMLKAVEAMKVAGFRRPIDVSSNRAGAHPGTHEVGFDSAADTLTLRHAARSREGFARGALQAAQWIVGKTGFYEFGEVLFAGKG